MFDKLTSWSRYLLIALLVAALALTAGCGSDGSDGAPGAPGEDGLPGADGTPGEGFDISMASAHEAPAPLGAEITSVTADNGEFTVAFTVEGITDEVEVEFTIAKWSEDDNSWVSMLQRNRTRDNDVPVVRASNLRPDPIESENGTFEYTLPDLSGGAHWTHLRPDKKVLDDVTVDRYEGELQEYVSAIVDGVIAAAAWDNDATYRIGVTSRQDERFTAVAYVDGAGNDVTDIPQQVSAETLLSCLDCHGDYGNGQTQFSYHSNRRQDPQLCTSCHNDFTYEAYNSTAEVDGWQVIDMMTMTHTIHAGIGETYAESSDWQKVRFPDWTFGRTDRPSDESPYPLSPGVQNCTACHQEEDYAFNSPLSGDTSCLTCHIDDNPVSSSHYSGDEIIANYQDCGRCHTAETGTTRSIAHMHGVPAALEALELARSTSMRISTTEVGITVPEGIIPVSTP
ncbi:multiheme c-type cytochrome [Desulfurispira natronophila]|uniref:OmcA/MtrC family decaheme c-type cytochrome n=1 Tax=Desulfurispira natronophila TaxID=682562 RepID=A0A7W7Y3B9_9BACT|nr:cytochrome c3 family protein [Desulfurispira natronophila]MBB5021263.1 OmcA/MtrC family decaheme c-type cytochrome [Desulfurispira natronophila]